MLDDSLSPSPSAVIYVFVDDNDLDLEVLKEAEGTEASFDYFFTIPKKPCFIGCKS